jgi:hypothetical protein
MARNREAAGKRAKPITLLRYVSFKYENAQYTLSPDSRKVYAHSVEVEKSRAAHILTAYRSSQAGRP